jgi:hypothetical protein
MPASCVCCTLSVCLLKLFAAVACRPVEGVCPVLRNDQFLTKHAASLPPPPLPPPSTPSPPLLPPSSKRPPFSFRCTIFCRSSTDHPVGISNRGERKRVSMDNPSASPRGRRFELNFKGSGEISHVAKENWFMLNFCTLTGPDDRSHSFILILSERPTFREFCLSVHTSVFLLHL